MSKQNQYKWLIIVEGSGDVTTYKALFGKYNVAHPHEYFLCRTGSKSNVIAADNWQLVNEKESKANLLQILNNDLGRANFKGVILLVDSDTNGYDTFDRYKRNGSLSYVASAPPQMINNGAYWYIDTLSGVNEIPIYGINVPLSAMGCLETALLSAYGFPIEGQPEYDNIVEAIRKASHYWRIPKHKDGKYWWEDNSKAKLDKFIYAAFTRGFKVSEKTPELPKEPEVITSIKSTIFEASGTGS
jgi:hypothetical protein